MEPDRSLESSLGQPHPSRMDPHWMGAGWGRRVAPSLPGDKPLGGKKDRQIPVIPRFRFTPCSQLGVPKAQL
jgi:hypothetical protein